MGLSNKVAGQVKYNRALEIGTFSDSIQHLFPLVIPKLLVSHQLYLKSECMESEVGQFTL